MKQNSLLIWVLIFFISIPNNSNAQFLKRIKQKVENISNEIKRKKVSKNETKKENVNSNNEESKHLNFEKGILFSSPSDNFQSFELQKYKNLPRFGTINSYGVYTSSKYNYDKLMRTKIETYESAQQLFLIMAKTKYVSKYFNELNKNVLYTKASYSTNQEERAKINFQHSLQSYIEKFAYRFTTDTGKQKYFTNPKSKRGKAVTWGGYYADEFQKNESYQNFVNDNLNLIKTWADKFLVNDEFEFYYVQPLFLSKYDFEKQVFYLNSTLHRDINSIQIKSKYNGDLRNIFNNYIPKNEFENYGTEDPKYNNKKFIYKIEPSKAKSLRDNLGNLNSNRNQKIVFMVRKVKMSYVDDKSLDNTKFNEPEFSYSFSERYADLYSDEALKNKIGSIQLFKNDEIIAKEKAAIQKEYEDYLNKRRNNFNTLSVAEFKRPISVRYNMEPPIIKGCEYISKNEMTNCFKNKITTIVKDILGKPKSRRYNLHFNVIIKTDGKLEVNSFSSYLDETQKNQIINTITKHKAIPSEANNQLVNTLINFSL